MTVSVRSTVARAAALVFMVAASSACAPTASGGSIQDFYVRNNGGNYVHYIYVSPTSSDDWEDDVLGSDTMEPYSEMKINMIGYDSDECMFDILVIDENGYERTYFETNLCRVTYVDFP